MPVTTETRIPVSGMAGRDEIIWRRTEENLARHAVGGREAIDRRLAELDREPDIESMLESNAALVMLAGALFAFMAGRRWFLLPAVAAGFLLQYARTRRGFPSDMLRRLGYRTRREIEYERFGLKALRGDFESIQKAGEDCSQGIRSVLEAERK